MLYYIVYAKVDAEMEAKNEIQGLRDSTLSTYPTEGTLKATSLLYKSVIQ